MANAGLAVGQAAVRGLNRALEPAVLRPRFDPGTWCTMAVCGNRLKARTYRRRHGL